MSTWLRTPESAEMLGIPDTRTGAIALPASYEGWSFLAMYTDALDGGTVKNGLLSGYRQTPADWSKLLELRVFDATHELWVHRSSIGEAFHGRLADDTSVNLAEDAFDEYQLLNRTAQRPVEQFADGILVQSATGGAYALPATEDAKYVHIRNYLAFDEETGRANIVDFRVVEFCAERKEDA